MDVNEFRDKVQLIIEDLAACLQHAEGYDYFELEEKGCARVYGLQFLFRSLSRFWF